MDAPLLLNVRQAAAVLGVSKTVLYELIGAGEVRAIRPTGHAIRVPRVALDEYVARKLDESAA